MTTPPDNRLAPKSASRFLLLALLVSLLTMSVGPLAMASEPDNDVQAAAIEKALAKRRQVLDEFKDKLSRYSLTENQDLDFAAFMEMYSDAASKMAKVEVDDGTDPKMKSLAKRRLFTESKEGRQFRRWVEQFHKFD